MKQDRRSSYGSAAPLLLSFLVLLAVAGCAPVEQESLPLQREVLVPGGPFHGIHGLTFDAEDRLYAGSVVGQATYRVDTESGEVEVYLPPPEGMADDLEFGPEGQLVWTAFLLGRVHSQHPGGEIEVLAEGLPGINSLAWNAEGRLFATQVFLGDALYEIDPRGEEPPRKILDAPGGLNGFDFGPDGLLYGPLWFEGQIVKVNVDSGELEVVSDGLEIPAAANFDSRGNLYALDTARGEVLRVDTGSGERQVVAQLETALDNLAFDSQDRLFVTNMANNGIYEVDTESGAVRTVVEGHLATPASLALWEDTAGSTLYVADIFAFRSVDAASGEITDLLRMYGDELENPMSVAVSEDLVLLATWYNDAVQRVDRRTGESLGMLHGFAAPGSLLLLDDGRFAVGEIASGRLVLVGEDPDDRRTVAEGLALPVGLAPAPDGAVYVSEAGAGTVSEIDLGTGEKRVIAADLPQPEGLAVDPDGRLVVVTVGDRSLSRIDPESGERTVLAEDLPVGLSGVGEMPPSLVPSGVAVASDGTIFVSSDLENAIYRFVPAGK